MNKAWVILHKKSDSSRPSAESPVRNLPCRSRNNERAGHFFIPARLLPLWCAPYVTFVKKEGVSKAVGPVSKSSPFSRQETPVRSGRSQLAFLRIRPACH